MKLAKLAMVNRHVHAIGVLDHQIAELDQLTVAVDGNRLDAAMTALARPVIERELRARIAELKRDLEALGVEIG